MIISMNAEEAFEKAFHVENHKESRTGRIPRWWLEGGSKTHAS
jgi:hypothetical protein